MVDGIQYSSGRKRGKYYGHETNQMRGRKNSRHGDLLEGHGGGKSENLERLEEKRYSVKERENASIEKKRLLRAHCGRPPPPGLRSRSV